MEEGVEYLKLNELISNGLISRNEKADVAWLALKDEFPVVNQDQFRRVLLRCRKSHAMTGKYFFGCAKIHLTLNTGAHEATETDDEDEDSVGHSKSSH